MISSKAIDLVKTFKEPEFKEFGLFVASPYFNRESIQVKFYEILKKNYPSFSGRNFTKELVFEKLYHGKKYNDGVMRNILSRTLELAENFLAIKRLQDEKFHFSLSLMNELSERMAEKLYNKAELKTEAIIQSAKAKDEQFYHRLYLFNNLKSDYNRRQKSALYLSNELIKAGAENITISFLISMLRSQTTIANSNLKMFRFDEYKTVDEFEKFADMQVQNYRDITYLQYCYHAFKLARTQDEKHFHSLKEIANISFDDFAEKDKKDIFTILTNYCYFKVNKGELNFRKEHFLLYKENFERGYYKGNRKHVDHIRYLNVVVTGLDAGEAEWVEVFIEKYLAELDDANRDNTYNFARALVCYHKKCYNDALDRAARVKTDDLSYKHQLKSLYLKIYFDMNDIEPFYSHVDSYRHFIQNEKNITENMRNAVNNYVNFTKKLFDIINRPGKTDFELRKLRKEILDNKALINKPWLLDKISQTVQLLR